VAKAKPVKKDTMSKLVEFITKHQNDKKKLNAGQIREMIKLVIVGLLHGVEPVEGNAIIGEVKTAPLSVSLVKEKEIAHHEAKLAELKKV